MSEQTEELGPLDLVEIIETEAIGIDPGWQAFAFEDRDWLIIIKALRAYAASDAEDLVNLGSPA